jgi:hypothetical protein
VTGAERADQGDAPHPEANASTGPASAPPDRPDRRSLLSARWREIGSPVVELAGIGVLTAGFWLIRSWSNLIVLGLGLIVIGFAGSPRLDKRK